MPAGTFQWSITPYPGPVRHITAPNVQTALFKGVSAGSATLHARVVNDGEVVCADSFPVVVVDCSDMLVAGPEAFVLGAQATFTMTGVSPGVRAAWSVSNAVVVSQTPTSVTITGSKAGECTVRARAMFGDEELSCEVVATATIYCNFGLSGPDAFREDTVTTCVATGLAPGDTVEWSTAGPIALHAGGVGAQSAQVVATGCGPATLIGQVFRDNEPTGCTITKDLHVLPVFEPLTISGLPERGYIPLSPGESPPTIHLAATGRATLRGRWSPPSTTRSTSSRTTPHARSPS